MADYSSYSNGEMIGVKVLVAVKLNRPLVIIYVPVTQVEEQQQGGNYTLEGINSTLRLGENHTLELEYARSESRAELSISRLMVV